MFRYVSYTRRSGLVIFRGYRDEKDYKHYLFLVKEHNKSQSFNLSHLPIIVRATYRVWHQHCRDLPTSREDVDFFGSFEDAYKYASAVAEAENYELGKKDDYYFPRSAVFWGAPTNGRSPRKFVRVEEVPM